MRFDESYDGPAVYRIRNKINGHYYIGSTSRFASRMYHHRSRLRAHKHSSPILQRAYDKYGEAAFICDVLEKCEIRVLIHREQRLLSTLKPRYNASRIAGPKTRLGMKSSAEHKRRMSQALMGRISPMKGKHFSREHCRRISAALTGRKRYPWRRIVLTGKRFGMLKILRYAGHICGEAAWEAQCECGKKSVVRSYLLRHGMTKSCGCLKRRRDLWTFKSARTSDQKNAQ